jgi:hypothetical protein
MRFAMKPIFGLLFFGAWIARADLDLSPTPEVEISEKIPRTDVVFHDGATKMTYQPPKGWTCDGSQSFVELGIPDHPEAKAFIRSAPRLRIPAFDDTASKLFQANARLLQLPRGAKDIKLTAVSVNPLVVDSHPTLEVDMTYSFFGQSCAKSILLVNRNGAEVSFVLDCLAPDFSMLEGQFRRSIFSIENL